jgi:hypothetical protein
MDPAHTFPSPFGPAEKGSMNYYLEPHILLTTQVVVAVEYHTLPDSVVEVTPPMNTLHYEYL